MHATRASRARVARGKRVGRVVLCGMVRSHGAVRGAPALSFTWGGGAGGGRAFGPLAGGGSAPQRVRLRASGVAPAKQREGEEHS